ncbi:PTS sugar transporter subunit IIB [Proteiniclasticum sp. C24MP]|uniref:PTS sugar transporter subunit IIB n=1 Tax=Proteiniclasticum sp. C24MP TaxID=3374101 RepID=UPI00375512F7
MKTIILLCAQGMSTGMLMRKMQAESERIGYNCTIKAMPVSQAKMAAKEADCLFLGPQVRYELSQVKVECPDVPVEVIDMIAYGRLDGAAVLKSARKLMND